MTVNLSTASSPTSADIVDDIERRINIEINQLICDIRRIEPVGDPWCTFGELFVDPAVQQYYEALVNTLKSAKRRGVVNFKGQILLKGMHDDVVVSIATGDGEINIDKPALKAQNNDVVRKNGGEKVYRSFSTQRGKSCSSLNTSSFFNQKNQQRYSKPSISTNNYQSARTFRNDSLRKTSRAGSSSCSPQNRHNKVTKDKQQLQTKKDHLPKVRSIPESLSITIKGKKSSSLDAIEMEITKRTSPVQNNSPCGEYLYESGQIKSPSSPIDCGVTLDRLHETDGNIDDVCDGASVLSFATAPVTSGNKIATGLTSPQVRNADVAHSKVAGTTFRSSSMADSHAERIAREIEQLVIDIQRLGEDESSCTFGALFDDPQVENYYEALVGTLKAARRKGLISFKGQMLLKGMHDNVRIQIV